MVKCPDKYKNNALLMCLKRGVAKSDLKIALLLLGFGILGGIAKIGILLDFGMVFGFGWFGFYLGTLNASAFALANMAWNYDLGKIQTEDDDHIQMFNEILKRPDI